LRRIYGSGFGGRASASARHGTDRLLAKDRAASELRRVLAATSDGSDSGGPAVEGADSAGRQLVGSGGYLRRDGGLQNAEAQGYEERQSLPRDWAMASRTGD